MITVLIPACNEAGAIGETVAKIGEVLRQASLHQAEIMVIDDGSTDGTAEAALTAGAKVMRNPHNVGYGASLKRGILAAEYETICIIDADLTYPEKEIPRLLAAHREGYDMVVAARTGKYYHGSALKSPLRKILRLCVEFAAGRSIPDANSGMRIFAKSAIREHLSHLCDGFSFTTSLSIAYSLTGRFILFLPTEYHPRVGHSKVKLFLDAIKTLLYISQTIVYYSPLKMFLLLSGGCVGFAVVFFFIGAVAKIKAAYFLGIGLLLVATFFFGIGYLADLIRQNTEKSASKN